MKSVLITDANQRSALAVARSLGRHGVPVYTADESVDALAGHSRHSLVYNTYPSPACSPDDFISAIESICKRLRIDIVIPMTEITATLLLSRRDTLSDIILPFADMKTFNQLADKCYLVKLAQMLNIPVPVTIFEPRTYNPAECINISLPLVLKPGRSWNEFKGKWIHTQVRIVNTYQHAEEIRSNEPDFLCGPYMIQNFIPGHGAGIFTIYDHGKPLAFFAHRRLREKPPSGGLSVLSESVPVDSTLVEHARTLLDHVNWHGVAMVEFRISTDGQPYLMEVNTRFWGSLQLSIDAGVDFPWMLYRTACGEAVSHVKSYKTGKRLRWLLGDLDSLYLILRDRSVSKHKKIHAVLDFIRPSPFRTRHEVNRWSDIRPFFWELRRYIRELFS